MVANIALTGPGTMVTDLIGSTPGQVVGAVLRPAGNAARNAAAVIGAAVTGAAVTGAAVTGAAVTGAALTSAALTGAAVTSAAVTTRTRSGLRTTTSVLGLVAPGRPQAATRQVTLRDGRVVHVRPARPVDTGKLLDFYTALSPQSRYQRYFTAGGIKNRHDAERLTDTASAQDAVLVVVADEPPGRIVAVGQLAGGEIALAVHDDYQGQGLGGVLLDLLLPAARRRGLPRVDACALVGNTAVLRLLQRRDAQLDSPRDGVLHATIATGAPEPTSVGQ